jgi:hypothetical protein
MSAPRWLIVAALVALAPAARGDDWSFTPKTPAEAAQVASYGLYPSRLFELRPSYTDLRQGGSETDLVLRLAFPMNCVIVPGLTIKGVYTIFRIDLPAVSLNTPKGFFGGLSDTHIIDGAVIPFKWGALGIGFGTIFPTATNAVLGFHSFQIGPGGGISVWGIKNVLSFTVLLEQLFGVLGPQDRPLPSVLAVEPSILMSLPMAFYLETQPIMTFDWNHSGSATIPVNLRVGHAFTSHLVMAFEPEWIATGDGKNNVRFRLILSYVGW